MASNKLMDAIQSRNLQLVKEIYETESTQDRLFSLDSIDRGERMTPLCLACKLGDKSIVEFLLQNGAKPNISCTVVHRNKSALHFACEHTHRYTADIVKMLLDAGADVEQETFDFEKPLYFACQFNLLPVVECLVIHGAEINCVNLDGRSPLSLVCDRRNTKHTLPIIKLLVDYGADVNNSDGMQQVNPFQLLIQNNNIEGVQYLIEKGFLQQDMEFLTDAVLTSNLKMVELLIQNKIDVNKNHSLFNLSPLHQACMQQNVTCDVVRLLLLNGANPNAESRMNDTPVHFACQHGDFLKVLLLLQFGANFCCENKRGFSPLDVCFVKSSVSSMQTKFQILSLFVSAGLNVQQYMSVNLLKYKDYIDPNEYLLIVAELQGYIKNPLNLTHICRIQIRKMVVIHKEENVRLLHKELPRFILDFLQLKDVC